jgi:hypothetical protein
MEYLNGSQATLIIREMERLGKIKHVDILTSTCHEDEITTKRIFDSGSQKKISKPINKLELVKSLKELNLIY